MKASTYSVIFTSLLISGCVSLNETRDIDTLDEAGLSRTYFTDNNASAQDSALNPIDDSAQDTHYSIPASPWWQHFHDEQLMQLINIALSESPTIAQAEATIARATAISSIDSSHRYPTVTGSLTQDYERQDRAAGIQNSQTNQANLRASWELDFWGKRRFDSQAAQFEVLVTQAQLDNVAHTLAADVARLWFQLLEQQHTLTILEKQIANTKVITEISEHRYRYAQESISAVWRQEQLLEGLISQHQRASYRQQIHEKQMNALLGRNANTAIDWQYPEFPDTPNVQLSGINAQILYQRPDVQQRWYQYQSRRTLTGSAQAARLPDITLNGNMQSGELDDLFSFWKMDLGLRLNVPLFNAGRMKAQHARAEAQENIAFEQYTDTVLNAIKEVEVNLLEIESQRHHFQSLKTQRQQAEQILELESMRYSRGMQSYLDVLNAQERLYNLQKQVVSAQRQLFVRHIALRQSIGGNWDAYSHASL
ncbi:efflux transporter outer membrane subunit [Thaumasiovibrio subtropicus]|uniref:efflux transporter outer membrane subunit n=1 Tax=Thaumasiovibrio subtropicus TaxID=1891207 RepID=UPI00131B119F|nr:TolC family protein [Thaumasiovibrio subtropicus]